MKKEELQKLGLTEEQINEVFKMNGLDVNGAKGELENAKKELENYKSQFTSTQAELKKLQELKPEELSKQVSDLNEKLATQKADFEKQIADLLTKSVATAGGREAKAIIPFLDVEALKTSQNQETDIKNAIDAVKQEHDYLFTSTEPVKNPVSSTSSNGDSGSNAIDLAKAIMGIKAE